MPSQLPNSLLKTIAWTGRRKTDANWWRIAPEKYETEDLCWSASLVYPGTKLARPMNQPCLPMRPLAGNWNSLLASSDAATSIQVQPDRDDPLASEFVRAVSCFDSWDPEAKSLPPLSLNEWCQSTMIRSCRFSVESKPVPQDRALMMINLGATMCLRLQNNQKHTPNLVRTLTLLKCR